MFLRNPVVGGVLFTSIVKWNKITSSLSIRCVEVLAIRPVLNFDEVSCHILTCIPSPRMVSLFLHKCIPQFHQLAYLFECSSNASGDQVSGQFSGNGLEGTDDMVIQYLLPRLQQWVPPYLKVIINVKKIMGLCNLDVYP